MKEFQLRFITNKQTIRSLKILSALQSNSDLSLKELAKITDSSDRTTLTDIQRIKDYFSTSIILEAKQYSGYTFKIFSYENFNNKKRALLNEEPLFRIIESIFFNECLTLDDWSDALYTTVSTLKKQLATAQKFLAHYEISFSKTPVDFLGDEINIRQFFHDFYYESDITPHTIFPSLAIQEISSTLRKENFYTDYSYISFTDFNYIVFVTIQRFTTGHEIKDLKPEAMFLKDYFLAHMKTVDLSKVRSLINDYFHIQLSELESIYLYTQLITRRSLLSFSAEKIFVDRFNLWDETKNITLDYIKFISVPVEEFERSSVFFESFFVAFKIKYLFAPVLIQNLPDVTKYVEKILPKQFTLTREFISDQLSETHKLTNKQINDISADLVMYTDSIRNFYWKKNRNIAILLEGNRFVTENIRSIFQRYLDSHYPLHFPDVTQLSIEYLKENKIDLIITNYSEYAINLDYGIDIILFEMIPTIKDWERLFEILIPSLLKKSHYLQEKQ